MPPRGGGGGGGAAIVCVGGLWEERMRKETQMVVVVVADGNVEVGQSGALTRVAAGKSSQKISGAASTRTLELPDPMSVTAGRVHRVLMSLDGNLYFSGHHVSMLA